MGKKYEFTGETKNWCGHTLRRICAVVAIAYAEAGELGGWIEAESNLSQDGDAWVSGNAKVYGDADVSGYAEISGDAKVFDDTLPKYEAMRKALNMVKDAFETDVIYAPGESPTWEQSDKARVIYSSVCNALEKGIGNED